MSKLCGVLGHRPCHLIDKQTSATRKRFISVQYLPMDFKHTGDKLWSHFQALDCLIHTHARPDNCTAVYCSTACLLAAQRFYGAHSGVGRPTGALSHRYSEALPILARLPGGKPPFATPHDHSPCCIPLHLCCQVSGPQLRRECPEHGRRSP